MLSSENIVVEEIEYRLEVIFLFQKVYKVKLGYSGLCYLAKILLLMSLLKK